MMLTYQGDSHSPCHKCIQDEARINGGGGALSASPFVRRGSVLVPKLSLHDVPRTHCHTKLITVKGEALLNKKALSTATSTVNLSTF